MNSLIKPPQAYFEGERSEVAGLVPADCQRVLDVGCGFGGLGRSLKARGFSQLFGIEINRQASDKLKETYQRHWIGDVEQFLIPQDVGSFDCLVFADILEHLRDPWGTLTRYLQSLKPGGAVVISIPNVRNIGLLYNLVVRGRWQYEDHGLLDRTHLRFFTRQSIQELVEGAGLSIESWHFNRDNYSGGRMVVARLARLFASEIDVCQYLVVARKP